MNLRPFAAREASFTLLAIVLLLGRAAHAQNDTDDQPEPVAATYAQIVEADQPVAWWRFEDDKGTAMLAGSPWQPAATVGEPKLLEAGPPVEKYPLFTDRNRAARFDRPGSLRYDDPGENSPLDFAEGDSITLEAWVQPTKLNGGQQVYVVGKGRTGNEGTAHDNQNWALRVVNQGGNCRVNFLFRNSQNRRGQRDDWHRWTSDAGFSVGTDWHHIAVTYTFGKGASIRGYIDGRETKGKWDYGGQTDAGPFVDDDQVWVGSSMGNNAGSSFIGGLDEVAVYRTALSPERIAARWKVILPKPYITSVPIPRDRVLVEVLEGLPDDWSWDFIPPEPRERYTQADLAIVEVPRVYTPHGVIADRSSPFVLWAHTEIELPAGKHRLLLRSRSAARLYINDELVAQNPFPSGKTDGHNPWEPVESHVSPNIRALQPGDQEQVAEIDLPAGWHRLKLELFVGGKRRRPETGETSVSIAAGLTDNFWVIGHSHRAEGALPETAEAGGLRGSPPAGLAHVAAFPLIDAAWLNWEFATRDELVRINQRRRAEASSEWTKYWDERHDYARDYVTKAQSTATPRLPNSSIDEFVAARLKEENVEPAPLVGDYAFVRRIYLDTVGLLPTADEVEAFIADGNPHKRAQLIDRLLADPRWADNWVGYWQDVLAENPNIVNPTLNNTGPFRSWIYEALLDNKPLDRFATELILMEGSQRYGGTAGFAVATENDAPLAAKAQNVSLAFLAFDMRCARCHDAPQHDFSQEDLFSVAAMLHRGVQTLPATSTIPGEAADHASLLVKVSLKPGDKIAPKWPFEEYFHGELPERFLENPADQREELAFRITSPQNPRFAKVMVNRLWHRWMGRGIVEPVDDWEVAQPTHPELLDWLARELMTHNYDAKHIARLVFNSKAYQREPTSDAELARLIAAPLRRRMTAEQVLDSLLTAADKEMHVEELSVDVDGSRLETASITLGRPRRAWQFTTMGNERDRPSLSLPAAQTAVTLLETFGWRSSRQDPLTVREKEPTVLQPAILANGIIAKRATQLSDDSIFVKWALEAETPADFVERAYRQVLSRPPTPTERDLFVELLSSGFSQRKTGAEPGPVPTWPARDGVSWSNHLQTKSNEIRLQWQKQVEKGDPPTTQLTPNWRERAEDMVWTLINSPEFVWVP